jgi:hypothetical protein
MAAKLRVSEWLIGLGSIALLASTLLPWFALPSGGKLVTMVPGTRLSGPARDSAINLNVWDLPVARWWVYLTILLGACVVLAALLSQTPNWSTVLLTPLVLVGLLATVSLLIRLADAPRPFSDPQVGFILALLSTGLILGATLWALRDETVPEGFIKAPRPEWIEVE